ncbi:MAG TPA: hypothetical protein VFK80_11110, partial [Limnochordia bacterium]|nr:hypothetical protein [Limnochordia bacterium]
MGVTTITFRGRQVEIPERLAGETLVPPSNCKAVQKALSKSGINRFGDFPEAFDLGELVGQKKNYIGESRARRFMDWLDGFVSGGPAGAPAQARPQVKRRAASVDRASAPIQVSRTGLMAYLA